MDAENYRDIEEHSTTYMYELKEEKGTYLLAWSTTPWTKIGTSALAVNADIYYEKVEQEGKKYILASNTLEKVINGKYKKIGCLLYTSDAADDLICVDL